MILFAMAAAAAAECQLDAAGVETLVNRANEALDRDDPVSHGAAWREMQERIPCLNEPIPAQPWANFLVGLALLERTVGLPGWASPLQVATEIDPGVMRAVGDDAFRKFVPAPMPEPGALLPVDATWWLDGRKIDRAPRLTGGPHIVQRETAGQWTTQILRDAPFPEAWTPTAVTVPVPAPTPIPDRAASPGIGLLWALGGGGGATQGTSQPTSFVPVREGGGAVVGLASHGWIQPGLAGAWWDAVAPIQLGAPLGLHASAGAALGGPSVAVLLGAGIGTAVIEQTDGNQSALVPRPHLGVAAGIPLGAWSGRAALGGGWTPATTAASGWLAAGPNGDGALGPVFGLDGGYAGYRFDEEGGGLALDVSQWWVTAAVGLALRP